MYKDMLSDEMNTSAEYKKRLDKIEEMVKSIPNNMQLGKAMRSYFWDLDERDISKNQMKLF